MSKATVVAIIAIGFVLVAAGAMLVVGLTQDGDEGEHVDIPTNDVVVTRLL